MATSRELIYGIKSILRGGNISDDDKLSDRQIMFTIDACRAVLLRQDYNKGNSLSDNHLQPIKCLSMLSEDESFDSSFPLGCRIFRSVQQIPKPIETKGKDLIVKISPTEFSSVGYDIIPYSRVPYSSSSRYNVPQAVLFNQYIYIVNAPYTEKIFVQGVWEQPNDLSRFTDCSGSSCFDWDSPYPLSSHLIDPVVKMCIEELQYTLKVPQDRTNDSNQSLESQNKDTK